MSEDRYTFEGKIGRGGIGAVYRAYDNQLGRPVAVKRMLPPEESDIVSAEDASSNLLKEAKVLSTLNHPNIVTVFDVGADSKGVFVVMELLEGETLDETISRGVLTEVDFSEVVVQTLEALIAAQDVDLVHRDIKPGNVMVVWLPSGKFQIKVLDFGLAKFSERPSVQTSDQGDAILGSIFFMAPEQFERGELDGRTDLYSLGCIYYHCLTGKYPFQGDTAAQVMASHLQNSMVPIEKYRPDLSVWLCNWVKWLLHRDLTKRPADAKTALEHFMDKTVGLPELQQEIEAAESAGVTIVGNTPVAGTATTGVVVAARAAAPPVMIASGGSGALPVSGAAARPPSMVQSGGGNEKAKWIAIGISALGILGVGSFVLFSRMQESKEENEFIAIAEDEAPFGDALTVQKVIRYIGPEYSRARRDAAARALSRMQGDGVDEEILRLLDGYSGEQAAALVKALTVRNYAPAVEKMTKLAASSKNVAVQKAALNGIMLMGKPEHVGGLLEVLKVVEDENVRDSVVRAILALTRTLEDERGRTAILLREIDKAEGPYRKSLASILGALGGPEVLAKFKNVLEKGKMDYRYDVLAALMNWPDDGAAELLQTLAEETEDAAVRLAAARAYIRMIGMPAPRTPGEQEGMLDIALSLADKPREKARVFPILGDIPQDWASDYAGKLASIKEFAQIAKRTQKNIRDKIAALPPLESGKPLMAREKNVGGSYEASYSKENECITNWRSPATWVTWDFIVDDPGVYAVKISQANDEYPGSTYQVIVGENAIDGKVVETRDWSRFVDVDLGEVNLPEPGVYSLTVKPTGTTKKFIMALRSVTLTKK